MQVVVAQSVYNAVQQRVAELDLAVDLVTVAEDGQVSVDIQDASAFLRAFMSGAAYRRVIAAGPSIQWVHTGSAGVDGLLSDELKTRGITLTNSAGVHAIPIAEWVMHALLMIAKRGRQMLAAQAAKQWDDAAPFDELGGKTLMIFGAGGIGQEIGRLASAFRMRVWGVNRRGGSIPHVERAVSIEEWRGLLPQVDFLVLAAPHTSATHHVIGAQELTALPSHAWLVNIARGGLVDEPALIQALQDNVIAGAALDTFEQEPLPSSSPLWTLPNVIVSPHHSAASPRTTERIVNCFIENLQRFLRGEPLINVVDYDQGY